MAETREARAKRIVNFYLCHKSKGKKLTFNHFQVFIRLSKDMKMVEQLK
jgi:hypothetical protein